MAPTKGLLLATMQPKQGLDMDDFNDWYNNEHGPSRLRLPFIEHGHRYRAIDMKDLGKGQPEWLALYHITDMEELTRETYTSLRLPENTSQREIDIMKKVDAGRKFYDLLKSEQRNSFEDMDSINSIGQQNVLVTSVFKVDAKDRGEAGDLLNRSELSKIPGWKRSRLYKTSTIAKDQEAEYLALHEFSAENDIPSKATQLASLTKNTTQQIYSLYYTFGPAPRDLHITTNYTSPDGLTKTTTPNSIKSYITTPDGISIPYLLEGCSNPSAPVILLSNCILANWELWTPFLNHFLPANPQYKILRYNTRGRSSHTGSQPITLNTLSSDIIHLLDTLLIPSAILTGDSLGGATVLKTALKHPGRVTAFISCDCPSVSPIENRQIWRERISIAEREAAVLPSSGEPVIGNDLAELTVRRWFHNGDGSQEPEIARIKELVRTNSLAGFKAVVKALYEYDLREEMKTARVRGLFVVGAQDGVLPDAMRGMADGYGGGGLVAECVVIEGAGHLPMVERVGEFGEVVGRFLSSL